MRANTGLGHRPNVPIEDAPASAIDRYERSLVETVTANGQFVLAAVGQITMAANIVRG